MLAAWASPAHAQAFGSIFGKVTDPSGGVLPGVTVTIAGTGLQQPLVGVTSENGTYQFASVPIGTYSVTFELASFKKSVRDKVVISTGFNAQIDQRLEIGQMSEEVTISAVSPVVDTKKSSTSQTFTSEVLEKIPTARDPWQVINMTPGVQAGLNVGGSSSGQQVSLASRGTQSNVQWNLEGGSITDLSSNSSPSYFNFDSFSEIQVTNGGGDVTVQSSGLSINLVTKSGSNVFKGSGVATYENDATQGNNVTEDLFNTGQNGFLSGNPIHSISNYSAEFGGPIMKNRLWFWGAADKQDINVGIVNFFDGSQGQFCNSLIAAQKAGSNALKGLVTYDKLADVQKCLSNDKTVIKDLQWKFNYQLNASNKFQYLFSSDNKYRNARGSSATVQKEASTQQTSDAPWSFPLPTHSITHTYVASDKLVFNNQVTYVLGGFFLDYQDVAPQGNCGQSRYTGSDQLYSRDSSCLWNIQQLTNRTSSVQSRSLQATYQTSRPSWEVKSDGTYFMSHTLGGDHSLKFGLGWRRNPILTFSHYSGGARATVECAGNSSSNCGDGSYVAPGSATGVVGYQAVLYRDRLINNNWWTYDGYLQDSYSRGQWRINGGLRYDWQQSKYLGGCVPGNALRPDLIPSQCETATGVDTTTGSAIQSFGNWSPRVSVTRDLFGDGKTQIHGNVAYYYDTRITLANALSGLGAASLTWGPNTSSGACTGTSCWQDLNLDGVVQVNELTGTPSPSSSRFVNGVLVPAGNTVDPSAKIGRTREAVVGLQHELISNLAVGVDFIYRKYDRGTANYTVGFTPGPGYDALRALYLPATYIDPVTGLSAQYYYVCDGCSRPSGLGTTTLTNPNYQIYKGVDFTMSKRYSHNWQGAVGITVQDNPQYFPYGTATYLNPTAPSSTGVGTSFDLTNGLSTIAKYLVKAQGSYTFPWDINLSGNFNWNQGATRTIAINGPGQVPGGTTGTINYSSLIVQSVDAVRFDATPLLDLSVQKVVKLRGGKERLKLMLDGFNMFNINGIQSFVSNNQSSSGFTQPASIVPPRVFRFGASIQF
ncbi:MAG TPA: carboxypeptidase regulatory-like domain-containing protein [Vicinamibacterales bacterium]